MEPANNSKYYWKDFEKMMKILFADRSSRYDGRFQISNTWQIFFHQNDTSKGNQTRTKRSSRTHSETMMSEYLYLIYGFSAVFSSISSECNWCGDSE
jgi:hypothetical protein